MEQKGYTNQHTIANNMEFDVKRVPTWNQNHRMPKLVPNKMMNNMNNYMFLNGNHANSLAIHANLKLPIENKRLRLIWYGGPLGRKRHLQIPYLKITYLKKR